MWPSRRDHRASSARESGEWRLFLGGELSASPRRQWLSMAPNSRDARTSAPADGAHDRGFASLAASLSDTAPELTGERGMLITEACLGLSREVARYGSNHPIWATTQRPRYSSMAAPRQTPGSPQHVRTERWKPASLTCSDRSTTSWSSSAAVVGTAAVIKHGHDRREDRRDDRGPGIFR